MWGSHGERHARVCWQTGKTVSVEHKAWNCTPGEQHWLLAVSSVYLSCWSACAGVRHSGIHRPRGNPQAGLREASGLVGDGDHPLWISGWLCPFLWRHTWGALWTSCQWWALLKMEAELLCHVVSLKTFAEPKNLSCNIKTFLAMRCMLMTNFTLAKSDDVMIIFTANKFWAFLFWIDEIIWPEEEDALPVDAQDLITCLLKQSPLERLGTGDNQLTVG